jgi:hypothetical protein
LETYNVALSNRFGRATLYERTGTNLSTVSSLEKKILDLFGGAESHHEVDVMTIDEVCNRLGIEHVGLLKIDAEGFDFQVRHGASELIKKRSIDIIEFEFVPASIETGVLVKDFFDILRNYELYRLALNGSLIPLQPYDYRFCEIFTSQHLIAMRRR